MSASSKAAHEVKIFLEFIEKSRLPIDPHTVESRNPQEPDIRCIDSTAGPRAFELVQLTDPQLAQDIARQRTGEEAQFHWTADSTEAVYRGKVTKRYETDGPIELLCYAALTGSPDDLVIATLEDAIDRLGFGQFERVWFLGQNRSYLIRERP
jgi:hypothetical protein